MKTLTFIAFFLLAISILSNAHGQTTTPTDSLVQYKLDSLQADTVSQLKATVDVCRSQVETLQCSPNMSTREFYTAAKNLAMARSALMLYIAQIDPQRAQLAIATARAYKRQAVAFNDKAVR